MKKLLFILSLTIFSCQKNDITASYAANSEISGKWKLSSYESQSKIGEEIIIEIKEVKQGRYQMYGKAPINFFWVDFEIIGNEIKILNTNVTEIAGGSFAQKTENEFFDRVRNIGYYEIEKTLLNLMNSEKNKKMTFTFLNKL